MDSSLPEVTEENIHKTLDSFMDLCEVFTFENQAAHPRAGEVTKMIQAVFAKNLSRFKAIHLLIDTDINFANTAYEVVRNMIEDSVSIEYLFLLPEEELDKNLERFFDFQWVQTKQDLDYYRSVGVPLVKGELPELVVEIEQKFGEVIKKHRSFQDKGKYANQWSKQSVEDKIEQIAQENGDEDGRLAMMTRVYILGNRSTHFNPSNVLTILQLEDDNYHGQSKMIDCYEAFIVAGICMAQLLKAYLDGVPPTEAWPDEEVIMGKIYGVEDTLAYYISNIAMLPHDHSAKAL